MTWDLVMFVMEMAGIDLTQTQERILRQFKVDVLLETARQVAPGQDINMMPDENPKLKPCRFCSEDFQIQLIRVDFKNPDRDIVKCRKCKGEAPRKYWNSESHDKRQLKPEVCQIANIVNGLWFGEEFEGMDLRVELIKRLRLLWESKSYKQELSVNEVNHCIWEIDENVRLDYRMKCAEAICTRFLRPGDNTDRVRLLEQALKNCNMALQDKCDEMDKLACPGVVYPEKKSCERCVKGWYTDYDGAEVKDYPCIDCEDKEWNDAIDEFRTLNSNARPAGEKVEELTDCIKNILFWKEKAETTTEMLLSSRHEKSDECAEIMKNYMESFKRARKLLGE